MALFSERNKWLALLRQRAGASALGDGGASPTHLYHEEHEGGGEDEGRKGEDGGAEKQQQLLPPLGAAGDGFVAEAIDASYLHMSIDLFRRFFSREMVSRLTALSCQIHTICNV